ncbi:Uncharacterised protein [Bordetella pertussis]|nr:Uncharacterised protein [Bordetella pertussis]
MANNVEPLIAPDEVQEILAEPKETTKPISWAHKPAASNSQWQEFSCACRLKGDVREDILFRITYRGARTAVFGQATIFLPEAFGASLFVGPHRVFGVDTDDSFHTSMVGENCRSSARRWPIAATSTSGSRPAKATRNRSCPRWRASVRWSTISCRAQT